jgi:hypothetical protein
MSVAFPLSASTSVCASFAPRLRTSISSYRNHQLIPLGGIHASMVDSHGGKILFLGKLWDDAFYNWKDPGGVTKPGPLTGSSLLRWFARGEFSTTCQRHYIKLRQRERPHVNCQGLFAPRPARGLGKTFN